MFLYRTKSSGNRQTEDLLLSGKLIMKIKNRPLEHLIKQGLDLRLDDLRLLVDYSQRARCGSTYVWTLYPIIIRLMGPCRRHLRGP